MRNPAFWRQQPARCPGAPPAPAGEQTPCLVNGDVFVACRVSESTDHPDGSPEMAEAAATRAARCGPKRLPAASCRSPTPTSRWLTPSLSAV